jgi:formate-dependent nitrite reductase cytochrome c552 subunit
MNQLAPMLSTANYTFTTWEEFEADAADWSQDSETTTVLREAGYALQFVISDGSKGLHNPAYAEDLLQNAIDYLSVQ